MKVGIYIPGLGQSFQQESVVKYATRLMNELSYNKTGVTYELKTEKINYSGAKESNVVSILENTTETQKTVYKLYEFKYSDLLTCKFNKYNIFIKSLSLLWLVIKKAPLLITRLFARGNYNKPFQTFYIFGMFLVIASSILFTIPAVFELLSSTFNLPEFQDLFGWKLDGQSTNNFLEVFVSFIAVILILLPQSRNFTTELSTEFICINNYLEFGVQSQEIHGNLDLLVEYIAEKEVGSKIHFHSYSCGSILAIDYLFQFGNEPSDNSKNLSEVLITIGTPYEFIKAYYPYFYNNRNKTLQNNITWINVYSIADALATSFREDSQIGEAQFGIPGIEHKPVNLNYEVAPVKKFSLANFFSLYSIRVHGMYWDATTEGQSCIRMIYKELNTRGLFY
ncbi:MAG: hypothetical protein Q8T03_02740 [Bacteroidota bacterium]|nr:hypothetical protein [Bacteroidota bacterium]